MSFKIHLVIIAFIIVAVFMAWEWTKIQSPEIIAAIQEAPKTNFSISVTHASWGLNCRERSGAPDDPFNDKNTAKLHEDNALARVSELCNGQTQCSISLTPATLGDDPAPECSGKALTVEYRCFSYDRPWVAKSSASPLIIDCDKTPK